MNLWQVAILPWVLAIVSMILSLIAFFTELKVLYLVSALVIVAIWRYLRWLRGDA